MVHYTFAAFSAVAVAGALALSGIGSLTGRSPQPWLDRLILTQLVLVVCAVVTGVLGPLGGRWPGDPLHFLYAALALAILPFARCSPSSARLATPTSASSRSASSSGFG